MRDEQQLGAHRILFMRFLAPCAAALLLRVGRGALPTLRCAALCPCPILRFMTILWSVQQIIS